MSEIHSDDTTTTTSSSTWSSSRSADRDAIDVAGVGRAMATGRWDEVFDVVASDVVAHVPAVGTLHGIERLAEFLIETAARTVDGEHIELLDALEGSTHAALYFRITAERPGRAPLDNLTVHLARIDAGRIVEIWFHNFDTQAVADFWS